MTLAPSGLPTPPAPSALPGPICLARPATTGANCEILTIPPRNGLACQFCQAGIGGDTTMVMAMTLRLADDESEALRRRAALEQRSMQEVARQAIREYVENHSRTEVLDRVLDEELPRYAEALERLGQ